MSSESRITRLSTHNAMYRIVLTRFSDRRGVTVSFSQWPHKETDNSPIEALVRVCVPQLSSHRVCFPVGIFRSSERRVTIFCAQCNEERVSGIDSPKRTMEGAGRRPAPPAALRPELFSLENRASTQQSFVLFIYLHCTKLKLQDKHSTTSQLIPVLNAL